MAGIGKPSLKNFNKPRPRILKVLGEWLSGISKTSAIGAFVTDDKTTKYVAISLFAVGWLGELLTKLYAATAPDYDERMDVEKSQMPPIDENNK